LGNLIVVSIGAQEGNLCRSNKINSSLGTKKVQKFQNKILENLFLRRFIFICLESFDYFIWISSVKVMKKLLL